MSIPLLTWLDFAERDRRRMLDVIRSFREQDTRDELGIGSVRDAFADLFFPGTSTIMTRARYFLVVPWLYLYREEHRRWYETKTDVGRLMRDYEIAMISCLEKGGEREGVIGIDARRNLQRLPSSIYWSGLARWGIPRFDMSIPEYHRWLGNMPGDADQIWRDDDGEPVAGHSSTRWDPAIPHPPADWLKLLRFALPQPEAGYLRERILASCPGTLLAHLVDHADPVGGEVGFLWAHPQLGDFPAHFRTQIEHARLASVVLNGAAWLYNLLLYEAKKDTDHIQMCRERSRDWAAEMEPDMREVRAWDLDEFWSLARSSGITLGHRTVRFVTAWVDRLRSGTPPGALVDDRHAREIVAARERELKRARSRLDNHRLLELWSGPAGTGRLHYRWSPVVRDVTNDILLGLREDVGDHA